MHTFEALNDFIERAIKNKRYPENTARGLKAALKIFEKEANESEADSLEEFKSRLDEISVRVFRANSKDFSVSSLATYKSRVIKVINDYEKYGIDPTKMTNWAPKVVLRTKKHSKIISTEPDRQDSESTSDHQNLGNNLSAHRIELSLESGDRCVIIIPKNMTDGEKTTVRNILNSLIS